MSEDTIGFCAASRKSTKSITASASKTGHVSPRPLCRHRYISDRFLPDKAIDLIDEAASSLRIQIDSMPTEKSTSSSAAPRNWKSKSRPSKKKKTRIRRNASLMFEKELAGIREQSNRLKAKWKQEKDVIAKARARERET